MPLSAQLTQTDPALALDQSRFLEKFDMTHTDKLDLMLMGRRLGQVDVEMNSQYLSLNPKQVTELLGINDPSPLLIQNLNDGLVLNEQPLQRFCLDQCEASPYGLSAVFDLIQMRLIFESDAEYVKNLGEIDSIQKKLQYSFTEPSLYGEFEAGGVDNQVIGGTNQSGYLELGLTWVDGDHGFSIGSYRGLNEAFYRYDFDNDSRLSIGLKRSDQPLLFDSNFLGLSFANDEALYARRGLNTFDQTLYNQFFSAPATVQAFNGDNLLKSFSVGAGIQSLPLDDLPNGAYQVRLVIQEEGFNQRIVTLPYRRDFASFEPVRDKLIQLEAGVLTEQQDVISGSDPGSYQGFYASSKLAKRISPSTVIRTQLSTIDSDIFSAAGAQYSTAKTVSQLDATAGSQGEHSLSASHSVRADDDKGLLSARLALLANPTSANSGYDTHLAINAFKLTNDRVNMSASLNYLDPARGENSISKTARIGYRLAQESKFNGTVTFEYSHIGDQGLKGDSVLGVNYTHVWRQPKGNLQGTARAFYDEKSSSLGRELEFAVSRPSYVQEGLVNLDQYYSATLSDTDRLGSSAYEAYASLRNQNDFSKIQLSAQETKCVNCIKGKNRLFTGSIDSGFVWSEGGRGFTSTLREAALLIENDTDVEIEAKAGGRRVKVGANQTKSLSVNSYIAQDFNWEAGGDTSDLIEVQGVGGELRLRDQQAGLIRFTQSEQKYLGFRLTDPLGRSMSQWSFVDNDGAYTGMLDRNAQAIISYQADNPVDRINLTIKDNQSSYSCAVSLDLAQTVVTTDVYTFLGEYECN